MPLKVPLARLNTGANLPMFGLGTWAANDDELRSALRTALDNGYRMIDTADLYGNEKIIGEVLQEYFLSCKLKREDVFITTKLPFYAMEPVEAEAKIALQLNALRLDYIDLFLIHNPMPMKFKHERVMKVGNFVHVDHIDHIDTWRVLEKWHRMDKLKAIGLSNFNKEQIEDLCEKAEIKPANLQHELQDLCKELGMTMTAYAPIGSPGRKRYQPTEHWPDGDPLSDPLVMELAESYRKTPAQVLLRHLLQREIAVIPKSVNRKRLLENADIFDFHLSDEDQQRLLDIEKRVRLFEMRFGQGNRYYPFDDVDLSEDVRTEEEERAEEQEQHFKTCEECSKIDKQVGERW